MAAADITDDERLDDSMLANRLDQLFQDIARKILPGLQWTRHDAGKTDSLNFFARLRFETNGRRPGADQRAETFAEGGFCHASGGYRFRFAYANSIGLSRFEFCEHFSSPLPCAHGGRSFHAGTFSRPGRRLHVLRDGGTQNRSARLSLRTSARRHPNIERTRAARRAAHFCDLDPRFRLCERSLCAP